MEKLGFSKLVAGIALAAAAIPAMAGTTGNGAPAGPHYQLNIIGVENAKKSNLTDSNRRTIFVPLKSSRTGVYSTNNNTAIVDSKIWLTPGAEFKVCDGNAFDLAYGCPGGNFDSTWNTTYRNEDGELVPLVSQKSGAVFQLPCNTNLLGYWDSDGDGKIESDGQDSAVQLLNCNQTVDTTTGQIVPVEESSIVPTASYQVWARALGTPGGSATSTTCATVQGELQCSLENVVMSRTTGKSVFTDVTNEMTSLLVNYCMEYVDGVCDSYVLTRVALFAGDTEDWFWNYDNSGLRLAQLRFYETE